MKQHPKIQILLAGMIFFILSAFCGLYANDHGQETNESKAKVEGLSYKVDGNILKLDFKLPFPGVVDFTLKSPEGKTLYRNYYNRLEGENSIKIKVSSLSPETTYGFSVFYKGSNSDHTFRIP